ncbi:MAG: hypothetical protein KJ607_03125 [Bacteroidetes bacterium]|nr:hypothetical protein [Bacteroidota bacterium]
MRNLITIITALFCIFALCRPVEAQIPEKVSDSIETSIKFNVHKLDIKNDDCEVFQEMQLKVNKHAGILIPEAEKKDAVTHNTVNTYNGNNTVETDSPAVFQHEKICTRSQTNESKKDQSEETEKK